MGFHWWELLPLLLIGILIFGPKKLPELGSSVGKTIKEFQKSMRDITDKPEETPTPQVTASPRPELSAPAATTTAPSTAPTTQAPTPEQPPV